MGETPRGFTRALGRVIRDQLHENDIAKATDRPRTRRQLALLVSQVSQSSIYRYLDGVESMNTDTLQQIADAMSMTVDELVLKASALQAVEPDDLETRRRGLSDRADADAAAAASGPPKSAAARKAPAKGRARKSADQQDRDAEKG